MPENKEKISACLVLHNEEKLIRRCLASIKDVVDEIIVVHDGKSQDKTLEICQEYGAKIFVRDYIGEAEPHRPFSFKQAKHEWILQIDADEFLSQSLRQNIKELILNKEVAGYEFFWPIWDGEKKISSSWPHKRCLYRKKAISFLGIPHFVVEINGITKKNQLVLEHQPKYNNYTWHTFKRKFRRWARIQAQFYLKKYADIEKFNCPGNDWPLKIKLRVKFPLLFIPIDLIITFLKNLISGGYKEGLIGLKVAVMIGSYKAMVAYYIFISKKK
jgi:glycosyltransferase involved in cell wall biosynthesis